LAVTRDVDLADSIARIAAAAGVSVQVTSDLDVLRREAGAASLVLIGDDMAMSVILTGVVSHRVGVLLVGLGRATKLLMLGDSLSAVEADAWGLVSDLVDDEAVDATAQTLAARLAAGPWQGYSATKRLLSRELDMSLSGAVELEAMTQALLMKGDDYREFYAAFTGKRPPQWTGH